MRNSFPIDKMFTAPSALEFLNSADWYKVISCPSREIDVHLITTVWRNSG